jgi:hypothetical protein
VDLTIHPELSHPPGDELGVLTPEIEDQDLLGVDVHQALLKGARVDGCGPYRYKLSEINH